MNQSKDVIYERQRKLFEYIKEKRSIKVTDASEQLGVSEITIRRDLNVLDGKNLIERFHGGAQIKRNTPEQDLQIEKKEIVNEVQKNLIGKKAASLVADGTTVFLNSGSTTLSVLKYLNNKSIRIITNNALAPSSIWSRQVELIMTGGECRPSSKSLVGNYATNLINNVYGDTCILGVNGIDSINGTTTSVYQETAINEAMVKRCNGSVIVVADSSKIGKSYNFTSIPIQDVDILITDSQADKTELDKIAEKGIKVITIDI